MVTLPNILIHYRRNTLINSFSKPIYLIKQYEALKVPNPAKTILHLNNLNSGVTYKQEF
jgi:hypothetical protein